MRVTIDNFMQDSFHGGQCISTGADIKGYLWKKESMTDNHFDAFAQMGRYPEIVNKLVRESISRTLTNKPIGMNSLSLVVDNPHQFLRDLFIETSLYGQSMLALNLSGTRPKIVSYDKTSIKNISSRSVKFIDHVPEYDEYGFILKETPVDVIIFKDTDGYVKQHILERDEIIQEFVYNWRSFPIKELPYHFINMGNRSIFYGLAITALEYYKVSCLRNYIMHMTVPQPVLTFPAEDSVGEWELSKLYEGENIDYGVGTFMKLPNGASFQIVTPSVRSLGEMRHELNSIREEMVVQGLQIYNKPGRVGASIDDTVRIHADNQMLSFFDVTKQVEFAINEMFKKINIITGENLGKFEFNPQKFDFESIIALIQNEIPVIQDNPELAEQLAETIDSILTPNYT